MTHEEKSQQFVIKHAIGTFYIEGENGIGGWSEWESSAKRFDSIGEAQEFARNRSLALSGQSQLLSIHPIAAPKTPPQDISFYRSIAEIVRPERPFAPQRIEELLHNPPETFGHGTIADLQELAMELAQSNLDLQRRLDLADSPMAAERELKNNALLDDASDVIGFVETWPAAYGIRRRKNPSNEKDWWTAIVQYFSASGAEAVAAAKAYGFETACTAPLDSHVFLLWIRPCA